MLLITRRYFHKMFSVWYYEKMYLFNHKNLYCNEIELKINYECHYLKN